MNKKAYAKFLKEAQADAAKALNKAEQEYAKLARVEAKLLQAHRAFQSAGTDPMLEVFFGITKARANRIWEGTDIMQDHEVGYLKIYPDLHKAICDARMKTIRKVMGC